MRVYERFFKRPLDVLGASIGLVVLSPALAVIAIAVRLTSNGPTLFRQVRVGRHGTTFVMFKFRTMIVDAPDIRNADGTTFNATNDPRVTALGRMLRLTSLDELPQLVNIVRGEMSIVGGRPDLPEGVATYLPHQQARLRVRPGLTSWAMLHGRNNVPLSRRRDLDAWYAENVGLLLDLRIIIGTVGVVLRREGVINEYSKQSPVGSESVVQHAEQHTEAR
jgi:undecaprenyl phosphate N,N'-diacetylbacillosamine 1-phosphate transferase